MDPDDRYLYERHNATQMLAPRQQRQRQLPESNFGQPRRSHERAQHQQYQQISRSQEREYYMMQQQQQQQQQQHYQQVRRQQPMDPFTQQYRQQQQDAQQQRQMSAGRPPRGGSSRSQNMRSTQIRREDFVEGRRQGAGHPHPPPPPPPPQQQQRGYPQHQNGPHLASPRRGYASAGYEDSEEEAPPARRQPAGRPEEEVLPVRRGPAGRQEESPVRKEGPGGTADMYKNFEVRNIPSSIVCLFVVTIAGLGKINDMH